ncbi:MAG: hypothetical protein IPK79_10110 [Vampirovibrionales bacterium]|nr:hypothetical protein [Vampirovibrionales bacterium]
MSQDAAAPAAPASPDSAAGAPPPVSTDVFSAATSRCTRRAWDIFLAFRNAPGLFTGAAVRGRITAQSAQALEEIQRTLREEGGLSRMSVFDSFIEFTAPLAVVQRVILHPGLMQFDAIRAD